MENAGVESRLFSGLGDNQSMNSSEGTFRIAVPAQRPGRCQVLLVCADVSNDSGGIHFEAEARGM